MLNLRKLILIILMTVTFSIIAYCEPVAMYFYGTAPASVRNSEDQAILNAKTELLKKIVNLYLEEEQYEENRSVIEREILSVPDNYISKKIKNKDRQIQNINGEKHTVVYFYADTDIEKIYDKLSKIFNGSISKPKIYIDAKAVNNIKTNDSDIVESSLKEYFKKLNFEILDSSIVKITGGDINETLKKYDCNLYLTAAAQTNLKIVEHQAANVINFFSPIINVLFGKNDTSKNIIGKDAIKALKECSGTTNLSVHIFNTDTGEIKTYANNFTGKAKGNVTVDNSAGVSHNSVLNSVNSFKKSFPLQMYKILESLDNNVYTVAFGNLSASQAADFEKQIKEKDKKVVEISQIHKNVGDYFTVVTKTDSNTFMSFLENLTLDNEPVNITDAENNIIGGYVAKADESAVNDKNIMTKLFNDNPMSVVRGVSIASAETFINDYVDEFDQDNYILTEQRLYLMVSDMTDAEAGVFETKLKNTDKNLISVTHKSDISVTFDIKTKTDAEILVSLLKSIEIDNKVLFMNGSYGNSYYGADFVNKERVIYSKNDNFGKVYNYLVNFQCNAEELQDFKNALVSSDTGLKGILSTFMPGDQKNHILSNVITSTGIDEFKELLGKTEIYDKILYVVKTKKVNDVFCSIECSLTNPNLFYNKRTPTEKDQKYTITVVDSEYNDFIALKEKLLEFDKNIINLTGSDFMNSFKLVVYSDTSKEKYKEFLDGLAINNKKIKITNISENERLKNQVFIGISFSEIRSDGTKKIKILYECEKSEMNDVSDLVKSVLTQKDETFSEISSGYQISSAVIDIVTKKEINEIADYLKGTPFNEGYLDIREIKNDYILLIKCNNYTENGTWFYISFSSINAKMPVLKEDAEEFINTIKEKVPELFDIIMRQYMDEYKLATYYIKTDMDIDALAKKIKGIKFKETVLDVSIHKDSNMIMLMVK